MKKIIAVFLIFECCLVPRLINGQQKENDSVPRNLQEAGDPFVQNYSPDDYKALNQNWGILQDSLGIIYFANGGGVLMYDGANWEKLALPKQSHTKSIAIDSHNHVYVGATNEFGYLEPDPSGKMKYVSLSSSLNESDQNFNTVWQTHATSDGIYFHSKEALFRWAGGKFKIWKANEEKFHNSFWADNTLYLGVENKGLMQIIGDELRLAPKGAFFANKKIMAILPFSNNELLIATLDAFYLYGEHGVIPFSTEIDGFIKENKLYSALQLNNGNYAIAGFAQGMAVIDGHGRKIFSTISKEVLPYPVLAFYQDRTGMLWAGLEYGVSKIEFPSPFSHYQNLGLRDRCTAIVRYGQKLYVGTANGLYHLESDKFGNVNFNSIKGFKYRIWDLLVFGDKLLVPSESAGGDLYEYDNETIKSIGKYVATAFLRSAVDTNRIFIARADGLGSIYFKDGKWVNEGIINRINGNTFSIVEEASGNLWLSTSGNWVWRISFENRKNALKLIRPQIEKFGSEDGLPDDIGGLHIRNNTVFYSTVNSKKTYEFDMKYNRFIPDKTINDLVGMTGKNVHLIKIDSLQNIFYTINSPDIRPKLMVAWSGENNDYKTEDLRFENHADLLGWSIYLDKDSVIWHGGKDGIIRQDLKSLRALQLNHKPKRALIKKVAYKQDSVIVGGAYRSQSSVLPFKENSFRFEYAYPNFYKEQENQFQHRLVGFDSDWSNWSLETQKDYTNISEGNYTFKVRAKNVYGEIGEEDTYRFTILPPWYRSWWAYLFYILASILGLWLFGQWRSKQLYRKNLILENIIKRRTEEISKKNKLLTYQSDRLKEMDTMKTRLFANISHEFRTPLTLIKGPIEKLEKEQRTTISIPNIKMIRRNANRLLNLVNQLLDLSKLDSGKLKLNEAEGDVYKCIRAAASAFSSHAASRNMDYQVKIPFRLLWAEFDRDKLEKIIYNLLSNAFKFTQDEGRVIIQAEFRSNRVNLKISDTGSGIHVKKLPHIFDRFFQVDDSFTKEKAGSGIGLALTKELVELMGGTIFVESEVGRGTLFRVVVPLEEIKSGEIHEEEQDIPITVFEDDEQQATTISAAKDVKMLIIEDNNDMRHFIREQLEGAYDIVEARNGNEGLQMANKLVPDLIITDLMMPQMDGITLCKKLKTNINTSHIPVIMLTAKAGIENKLEGLETGADEYLTKPFNARELQIRSKNLIEQRQQLREIFSKNISLDPQEVTVTSMDEKFLKSTLTLLEEKYADSQFGVPQMQKELGMGKTSLHNKLKALTSHPPGELLRNFRLQRATQLLTQHADNISQVAFDVGFNSPSYFTRCFKEYYGSLPSDYLKNES